jgi:hypothetical protein
MKTASQGAAMMFPFKRDPTFALPASSNAHVWEPMKVEKFVVVYEDKNILEEHLDGDEEDPLGDNHHSHNMSSDVGISSLTG